MCLDIERGVGAFFDNHVKPRIAAAFARCRSPIRIWLICILLNAIVVCQIGYTVWRERNFALIQQGQNVKNLSLVLAEQTSRYIANADLVLQAVQAKLQESNITSEETLTARVSAPDLRAGFVTWLQSIPGDNGLLLTNANGRLVGQFRPGRLPPIDIADSSFFRHFKFNADDGLLISRPARVPATGTWTFFLVRRLSASDGRFLGVVATAIDARYLQTFYRTVLAASSNAITLLRRDGQVLIRYPEADAIGTSMPPRSPWYGVVFNGGGIYDSPGFFGARPGQVAAQPVPSYPLVIDVVGFKDESLAPWRSSTRQYALIGAIAFSGFIVLFWVVSKQLQRQQAQNATLTRLIGALRAKEAALQQSQERLSLATESAGVGIWDWDIVQNKLVWDSRMYELYGIDETSFSGAYDAWQSMLHPDDRERGDLAISDAIRGVHDFNIEFRVLWPDGAVHAIEAHALVQQGPDGRAARMIGVNWDITERRRAAEALQASERRYRDLFELNRDGIVLSDPASGEVLAANSSALRLYGAKDLHEISAHLPWELAPECQPDGSRSIDKAEAMNAIALRDGSHAFEWMCRRIDGSEFPAEILLTRVMRGERKLLYGAIRDITDRKRAERQIARMASLDSLTGLVNRRMFLSILEQTIARAHRSGTDFAVLYLDLDHFKDVNDTLGHPTGDLLLRAIAERLQTSIRSTDVVARFGGDEFAILLDNVVDPLETAAASAHIVETIHRQIGCSNAAAVHAARVAERIISAVAEPLLIDTNRIHPSASVGISVYGENSPDGETVLSQADVALYRAKAERRGSFRFFADDIDAEVRARVAIRAEIREGLDEKQFFLVYQPQVDIETRQIVGVESLLRWRHPKRGVLGPGQFIPEAERSGLIVPLGAWVIGEASRQLRQWLDAGVAPPLVAVNLSGVQFKMPRELIGTIAAATADAGVPAQRLELELTESVLMEASQDNNDVLLQLRAGGHRLAIDDFGSGYSSLDYLRRFPVDRIKIAQGFTRDIGIEPGNDAIVRAALGLARELRIEVVVEGVETFAQLGLLRSWGGRIVQGFYFSRPQTAAEMTGFLRAGTVVQPEAEAAELAAE